MERSRAAQQALKRRFADFLRDDEDRNAGCSAAAMLPLLSGESRRLVVEEAALSAFDVSLAQSLREAPEACLGPFEAALNEAAAARDDCGNAAQDRAAARHCCPSLRIGVRSLGGGQRAASPAQVADDFGALGTLVAVEGVVTKRAYALRPPGCNHAAHQWHTGAPGSSSITSLLCRDAGGDALTLRELPEAAARDACGALLRPLRDVLVLLDGDDLEATPGARVCVVGTLKAALRPAARAGGALACVLAVVACSVTPLRRPAPGHLPPFVDAPTAARVRQLAAGRDPLGLLAASLAPELGAGAHAWPRRALVLQLAAPPRSATAHAPAIGGMHCLLLGGPPAARAALLRAAAAAAPRATESHAQTDAPGGLTAAVRRDEETGRWALHAGAMVLADDGVACVDGFEALDSSYHDALCHVLAQPCVNTATAGINEAMHARCALLAAAGGACDASRSVAANLAQLPAALIQRFHLAWVLRQEPPPAEEQAAAAQGVAAGGEGAQQPAPVSAALLRAHIAMSRVHRRPEIPEETVDYASERYKALRQAHASAEAEPPVSASTLETMVSLAMAHARLRLGDTLLPADVDVALQVMHAAVASGGRWAGRRTAPP